LSPRHTCRLTSATSNCPIIDRSAPSASAKQAIRDPTFIHARSTAQSRTKNSISAPASRPRDRPALACRRKAAGDPQWAAGSLANLPSLTTLPRWSITPTAVKRSETSVQPSVMFHGRYASFLPPLRGRRKAFICRVSIHHSIDRILSMARTATGLLLSNRFGCSRLHLSGRFGLSRYCCRA
jgi:hypothetical protein